MFSYRHLGYTARTCLALLGCLVFALGAVAQTAPSIRPAAPVDPIAGIVEAFKSHDVVALGEGNHGNEQGAAFRLALIRDPRFAAVVDDIVVESGNALYQDVIDRFVSGQDVPEKELRQFWQNTTQSQGGWDTPIYEQFFRAIREVNRSLPAAGRLRVLLGDPPIDWSKITTFDDFVRQQNALPNRDEYPAQLIQREVLEKHRRALVVYGDGHLLRKPLAWTFADSRNKEVAERNLHGPSTTVVGLLEAKGARIYSIRTNTAVDLAVLQADVREWPTPSLAPILGTSLGRASFAFYYPDASLQALAQGAPIERVTLDMERTPLMQDQFDAILYLGPPSSITQSRLSAALCRDADYLEMRSKRMSLTAPPGMGIAPRALCARRREP